MGKAASTGIDGSSVGLSASKTFIITSEGSLATDQDNYAGGTGEDAGKMALSTGLSIYRGDNTDDTAVDTTAGGTAGSANAKSGETSLSLIQLLLWRW